MSINIPDILKFFSQASFLLQALTAGGIIKTSSGTEISTILTDVSSVVSGTQQPTADLANSVVKLLGDLGTDGIVQGQIVQELSAAAAKFAQVQNDITTGQAALLGTGDLLGKHGSYLFVADGGPAASSLGL